ncbi:MULTISPECIES: NifU family protein [Sphingosinicellaceae]|uniref:NifU family protein n=1 Tax=Sphingosinicellaceae TaxID=2820280 RepID=UPI001C1DEC56|nr:MULTISPECIES: NifU family protein [Polymorphobacter]QYE35915.1 NifU family protein [Polymorphobacter sp. PAMC 29334]UAJ10719.1 NifU family protein [Polymorphobacter megasporae]
MYIETERTPNPQTLKFLPGRPVMPSGTIGFTTPEDAAASPLAAALFGLGDVEGVFFGSDFVSVNKAEGSADWSSLKTQVLGILVDHFSSGAPIMAGEAAPAAAIDDDPEDADIVAQIIDLLDTRIRPQVANDGGDIIYRGFNRGIVSLQMQGACSGCPSSTATLKGGIESLLKYYVPEVVEVRAV